MTIVIKIIFIFFFFGLSLSYASENEMPSFYVSQRLTQGLTELKNSVDQISASNELLVIKNTQLKSRLNDSRLNLQKLIKDNQELTKGHFHLEGESPIQVKRIDQLEKNLSDLDNKENEIKEQIRGMQENLSNNQKEDQQLSDQIVQMQNGSVADHSVLLFPELSELYQKKQKEKLTLLKVISESKAHQGFLQEKILDLQRNVPMVKDQKVNQRSLLEDQIQQLQMEVSQLSSLAANSSSSGWGERQIYQLEDSVKDLEKNRDVLKDLVARMQKKAQNVHLSEKQQIEQFKLQSNIDELKVETKSLKFDLEELQQQMVELDKRKSYMEELLRK